METVATVAIGLLQTAGACIAFAGIVFLIALRMVLSVGRKAEATQGDVEIKTTFGSKFSISYTAKKLD